MQKSVLPYLILFICGIGFFFLLRQVYPYLITQPDSLRYVVQGKGFTWNELHVYDKWHPPLYSLVLAFCLMFSEPTALLFWIHALAFTGSILVTFTVACRLFVSQAAGFAAALLLFLTEAVLFRVPFYAVEILTEPLYVHLVCMGTLLVALQVVRTRTPSSVVGFFLLGLAALTRRIGLVFLVLWVPVFLCSRHMRKGTVCVWLSFCLLVLPISLWTVRNAIVAEPQTASKTSQYLSWRLSAIASAHGILSYKRAQQSVLDEGEYVEVNRRIVEAVSLPDTREREMAISRLQWEISRHILLQYFPEYLALVLRDYVLFFNPHHIRTREYIAFRQDPNMHYDEMRSKQLTPSVLKQIYPNGTPESADYDTKISKMLYAMCCDNPVSRYVWSLKTGAFIFIHAYALLAGILWFALRKSQPQASQIAGVICIVLLTAFAHAMATVMVMVPGEIRFSLPGSLLIHFALVLGTVLCLRVVFLQLCVFLWTTGARKISAMKQWSAVRLLR